MKPTRIQRKRSKGFKMPDNTIYVGRPTIFGNPYSLKTAYVEAAKELVGMKIKYEDPKQQGATDWKGYANALFVQNYRTYLENNPELVQLIKAKLKGKNLACWCGFDSPCHADVLLEIANAE